MQPVYRRLFVTKLGEQNSTARSARNLIPWVMEKALDGLRSGLLPEI
jgi:hypothetical protein